MRRMLSRVAVVAGVLLVTAILLGPALAPYDPAAPVAGPWAAGGSDHLLGTDVLGRDVLSRAMAGGRHLLAVSLLAAVAASLAGALAGLAAGWAGSRTLNAAADLMIAVPVLLPALLLAVSLPGDIAVVTGTVLAGAPLTLRVAQDAAASIRGSGYVRAARLRGERGGAVLLREVMPAMAGLLAADVGLRFVTALQLASALAVLGFGTVSAAGTVSSAGSWAVMLRENLPGAALNPAALVVPALLLAVLALTVAAAAHTGARRAFGTGETW
ncbi:ABC transporter permease subunit [Microbispora sp. CA-102843]|uniref:ABC transporter permease subunit n=1 Tax=Microbispora sp. CA-102843 TaxID=3239952 RepID=UPI003D944030